MYLDPRHLLRALATPHAAYTDAGGARGWYCVVNPLHVRLG